MRRVLIALLVSLFATFAQAQTGSNKTAAQLNTEIGTTGCTQPTCLWPDNVIGLITPFDLRQVGLDLVASTGVLSNTNTWTATQTFTPAAGTTTQGIVVSQSLPGSCSVSCGGPFNFSSVSATNAGYQLTGTTLDSFGLLLGNLAGFRVNLTNSGTNGATVPSALVASVRAGAATNPNLVGATLSAYSNINSSGDALWAGLGFCNAGPAANILQCISWDAESAIATGGVVKYRYGLVSSSIGPAQASGAGSIDAAIVVRNAGTFTTDPNYATAISWHNGLTFVSAGGNAPLDTTGNAIFADGTFTTGSFVNMPNVTFTGNIFNLKQFLMTGAGATTLTGPSGAVLTATTSSGGAVQLFAEPDGVSGLDGVNITDSSGNDVLFSGVQEHNNSGSVLGQNAADYAKVVSLGTTNLGMLIGTRVAHPVIFGTNDAFAGLINSSQQWMFGPNSSNTPASGVLLTLNNQSAVASPAVQQAGALLQIVGANAGANVFTGMEMDAFANGQSAGQWGNIILGFATGGTLASQTATPSGALIFNLTARGYDGTSNSDGASINMKATALWAHGSTTETAVIIQATPVGSTTKGVEATWQGGLQVGAPTGGAKGIGTINAAGAYYENGAQGLTQTCTVNQAKTLIFTGGILTGGTCNS